MTNENQKAVTVKTLFSRETSVSTSIQADPAIIWSLLTNAGDFARWNSTVLHIEGQIRAGEKIKLRSTLDPKRSFSLRVRQFEPGKTLSWGDGKGLREYRLRQDKDGNVLFSMREKIGGLMFPLYARYIPSFDASFDQFAADLKKEAELIAGSK